jgi:hypothetical protein
LEVFEATMTDLGGVCGNYDGPWRCLRQL